MSFSRIQPLRLSNTLFNTLNVLIVITTAQLDEVSFYSYNFAGQGAWTLVEDGGGYEYKNNDNTCDLIGGGDCLYQAGGNIIQRTVATTGYHDIRVEISM